MFVNRRQLAPGVRSPQQVPGHSTLDNDAPYQVLNVTLSDQSTTDCVDHRLEAIMRAELLIHVVEVIAKGL